MTTKLLERPSLHDTSRSLLDRALDPSDPSVAVIGWPGRRLAGPILGGDVVVRRAPGGPQRTFILTAEVGRDGRGQMTAFDIAAAAQGLPPITGLRLFGPDRLLRPDLTVVRALPEWTERDDPGTLEETPPTTHPTIRSGSRGPAVSEAQQRLNIVDTRHAANGLARIERCPLEVDGIFGKNTRAATVSFQHFAFPALSQEWDGIIGPKTWTALLTESEAQVVPPPPPPPKRGVLNPARWSAILRPLAVGGTELRAGNAVAALVDGQKTFNAMAADMGATSGSGDFIYLLGWDNFDDFKLGAASTFREIYTAAAKVRGVQVAAMLWAQPSLTPSPPGLNPAKVSAVKVVAQINSLPDCMAIEDDKTTGNTTASTIRLAIAAALAGKHPKLIPVILRIVEPDIARLTGSHHQKLLVVKRGGVLVGYCGGIDMNPNRVGVVDAKAGQPHHDTHCRIMGPSAHDLLATFLERWRHHPDSSKFGALRGASLKTPPSPIASPSPVDAPFGGPLSVMIARTFNPVNLASGVIRQRGIKLALLAAIANARRFIYCEDQYLVDSDTANALIAAIPRLSHVTVLIPGNKITDMPFAKEYRRDFVEKVRKGLSSSDRDKFRVFQLSTSQSKPDFGDHTYVHSKSWVIDDEIAIIGTANCNRRSYTFDSEVDAFVFEDNREPGDARQTFAQRYRMELWQHHLGRSGRDVEDGVKSGELWRAGKRKSAARVFEFDHSLPSGFFTTDGLWQEVMNVGAERLQNIVDPTI